MAWRMISSITLPITEVRLATSNSSDPSSSPSCRCVLHLLTSSQLGPPSLPGLLVMITAASSLNPCGWIPSSPMDLGLSEWHSMSLTVSLLYGAPFCSLSQSSSSGDWVPWGQLVLLLKAEGKKALSTSAFSSPFATVFPSASNKAQGKAPGFSLSLFL